MAFLLMVSEIQIKLVSFVAFFIAIMLMGAFKVSANTNDSFQFTTATGRAVITQTVPVNIARMRALEDALYLAALQGGANINGFSAVSTDTSVQDHFVIRPSSNILDYTVLSESQTETQIELKIRAAVGTLPERKCKSSRPLNITLYKPKTSIDMNVPAWMEIYHSKLFNKIALSLNNDPLLSVKNTMNVELLPEKLKTVDERYDYSSLISPQVRVIKGDYAAIPTLTLNSQDTASRFLTSRKIEIKLGLNVFQGGTYNLIEKFEKSIIFENDRITLFQTLADLDKKSRKDLIIIMESLIEPLLSEMITALGCQPLNDVIYLDDKQLRAQIGSNQGISENMLAITLGKHTPWTMLRVVSVSGNNAVLEPLDKSRKLNELDGKTVEFMELN